MTLIEVLILALVAGIILAIAGHPAWAVGVVGGVTAAVVITAAVIKRLTSDKR